MNIKEIGNEFKAFILKGNVVDLATGVIIGAAFGKIVTAFTTGIVGPLINALGGDSKVSLRLWVFDVGEVITSVIQFTITAAVIFFLIVKPMNAMIAMTMKRAEEKPSEPQPIPEDVKLLIEIRDILKNQSGKPVA